MMTFFHGGFGGLKVGDLVLPADETGAPSTASYGSAGICRTDRVYITVDEAAARVYAALHPSHRGKVYEVEPVGEIDDDVDCLTPGYSFCVPRARVLRVIQISNEERRQIVGAMLDARSAR